MTNCNIRLLVAKPGLDGHDRGANSAALVSEDMFGEHEEPKLP